MNATTPFDEAVAVTAAIDRPAHPVALRVRDIVRAGSSARRTILLDDEENIVQAVRHGIRLDSVYLGHGIHPISEELAAASHSVPLYRLSTAVMGAVFGGEKRTRVFALAERPARDTLGDVARRPGDVVILDGVRLAGNIGAITRSAAALGAAGVVLVDSGMTSAYDRRLIRASRGLVFALPVVLATRDEVREFLREASIPLVGLTAEASAPLAELAEVAGRLALLLGGERDGASDELDALVARRCAIRIDPDVDSLNVSVAGAIALYERRRRCSPSRMEPRRRPCDE